MFDAETCKLGLSLQVLAEAAIFLHSLKPSTPKMPRAAPWQGPKGSVRLVCRRSESSLPLFHAWALVAAARGSAQSKGPEFKSCLGHLAR